MEVVTFGCRLNAVESEALRERAAADGVTGAVVFNTCAVTGEAVRQARQAIRKASRARPGARMIVTGCAAQIDPAMFSAMPEVDLVLGVAEKTRRGALRLSGAHVGDIMTTTPPSFEAPRSQGLRARAYVEIQNGCDHRCTFCVIPYGRGNSRSTPAGVVVERVRALADTGCAEVVLTGVDLTSWGADLPERSSLGDLVRRILREVADLPRLRLSSIDAAEIDAELMACLAEEPRLMPHLHLSLQAGDDLILKRMKRRHSRSDALRLVADVRRVRPDTAFGADLIAGFPTETDGAFANTLSLVEEAGLAYLHVFPFSPRPNTPAARMPRTPDAVVKARAARLREAGEGGAAAASRPAGRNACGSTGRRGRPRPRRGFHRSRLRPRRRAGNPASRRAGLSRRPEGQARMTEPRKGWLSRLSEGLSRTSRQMTEQVAQVLVARPLDQDRLEALEEMLIEADLGPAAAARITDAFSAHRFGRTPSETQVMEALAAAVADELTSRQGTFDPLSGPRPFVVLFIGVNGSGKTTTLGKIAADLRDRGARVLIAAGDTFRAAAVEQLQVWAERSGADFISRPTGADAAGLAFDALERARAERYDVLLIDTAGRLQNKQGPRASSITRRSRCTSTTCAARMRTTSARRCSRRSAARSAWPPNATRAWRARSRAPRVRCSARHRPPALSPGNGRGPMAPTPDQAPAFAGVTTEI